jgi:hypothetical protein
VRAWGWRQREEEEDHTPLSDHWIWVRREKTKKQSGWLICMELVFWVHYLGWAEDYVSGGGYMV